LIRREESSTDGTAHDRTILTVSVLSAVVLLPLGLHLPYFPVYLSARGLTQAEVATVLAAPLILRIVVIPIVAAIADARGIAGTLAAATLVLLAAYCSLGLADGLATIFACSVLAATALGVLPSLNEALTLSHIRRTDAAGLRPIAYGRIRVFTPIGVLAVMLLSGPIVAAFPGGSIVVALAVMAFMTCLASIYAAATLRTAHHPADHEHSAFLDPANRRLAVIVILAAALVQSSHAQVYSFGTLHWRASGYSADFIGVAWAVGVAAESIFFLVTARFPGVERAAPVFIVAGGTGALIRWLAMSTDPAPLALVALQAMHGLSFAATTFGSVLVLGSLAGPSNRARMQGRLAAASALGLALATFVSGRVASGLGESAYLLMAALASAGLCLAILGGLVSRRLPRPRLGVVAHSAAGRSAEP
jgi:PPP family 3-phenylpropionic acid transporter